MSIISALNSAKSGMNAAATSFAKRAAETANTRFDSPGADAGFAENQVGQILDKTAFKANARTFKVADNLMGEIVRMGMKSNR